MKKIIKQNKKKQVKYDVRSKDENSGWLYTDKVKDHFFSPRNFMRSGEENKFNFNGYGRVGSPTCGDEMVLWLQIDPKTEKIKDCRWRTFGCGSAIASTSVMSEIVKKKGGMKIDAALKLTPQDIMKELGGLPDRKVHCSVLGDKALHAAINDYFRKTKQHDRIVVEGSKVIDPSFKITDKDIEEAILDGARTLQDVQKKLKVGVSSPEVVPAIEELIRFYTEKYF